MTTTTVPAVGCRTLCQHPGCGLEIGQVVSLPGVWVHIGIGDGCHVATPAEPVEPVGITCPGLGCRGRAWQMPGGRIFCEETGTLLDEDEQEPAAVLPRQALEQPSSLVDALLEAAGRHGVDVVQSPGTYRAAEQAAGLLQQIVFGPKDAGKPESGEIR